MLELVEKDEGAAGKIAGGTVLEVGSNQTRLVTERNDPGPSGAGHTVEGSKDAMGGVLDAIAGGLGK